MNILYIILLVGVIAGFELGKILIKNFLNKKYLQHQQAGFNQAVTHIYNQVQKTGKIDLVLDGKKIILIKLKEKNGSNN
mgnify:CR=1 FL=1